MTLEQHTCPNLLQCAVTDIPTAQHMDMSQNNDDNTSVIYGLVLAFKEYLKGMIYVLVLEVGQLALVSRHFICISTHAAQHIPSQRRNM